MLSIGEVAERAGLRTSAIRYYEDVGILPPAERANGRRRYGPDAVERLEVVRFAQSAGLTLDEIRVLFHGFGADVPPPPRWREVALRKLRDLDEQVARIARMRGVLEATLDCGCVTLEDCARETSPTRATDDKVTDLEKVWPDRIARLREIKKRIDITGAKRPARDPVKSEFLRRTGQAGPFEEGDIVVPYPKARKPG